jgi:AcrR family transcriptional regulator
MFYGMEDSITHSPRRNKVRRAKAANRPSKFRERLLEVGARLFVERGIANVSVEELIDAADVSRATFYGFFANKNELAAAILLPVFDSGIEALANLDALPARKAAEALISVYLHLWTEHRNALLLTGNFDGNVFPYIRQQHDAFNLELHKALQVIESGGLLRNNSANLTLSVLAKTAIPLLQIYKDREELESTYRASMLGLIIKA